MTKTDMLDVQAALATLREQLALAEDLADDMGGRVQWGACSGALDTMEQALTDKDAALKRAQDHARVRDDDNVSAHRAVARLTADRDNLVHERWEWMQTAHEESDRRVAAEAEVARLRDALRLTLTRIGHAPWCACDICAPARAALGEEQTCPQCGGRGSESHSWDDSPEACAGCSGTGRAALGEEGWGSLDLLHTTPSQPALGEEQRITDAIPTEPMPGWNPEPEKMGAAAVDEFADDLRLLSDSGAVPVESLLNDDDYEILGEEA